MKDCGAFRLSVVPLRLVLLLSVCSFSLWAQTIADPATKTEEQKAFESAISLPDPDERVSALEHFLAEFPQSDLKEQAWYLRANSIRDPEARAAAQERFAAQFPKGAAVLPTYRALLNYYLKKNPLDSPKLLDIINRYVNAVPKADRGDAYCSVADALMQNGILLQKAIDFAQAALDSVTEATPQESRAVYLTTMGEIRFKRQDYPQAKEALMKAVELRQTSTMGEAYLFLGKVFEAERDTDAAVKAYSNALIWLDSNETRSSFQRSYLQKHGSLEGFHEALDRTYLARPKPFDPGKYKRPASPGSGKVVLAELFTGAQCGPCISADLAFDGLIDRYDRNTLAILEYHLHVPGPDPLTNGDSERRARYYGLAGTPGVLIDGTHRSSGGGGRAVASRQFDALNAQIESILEGQSEPQVRVDALKVTQQAGRYEVSGAVILPRGLHNPGRLRLAVVEDVVHYTGANGVHFNYFVVRKLLTGADGIQIPDGVRSFPFSTRFTIEELEAALKRDLMQYEAAHPGFRFQEYLDHLNEKQLSVVAFVQDDSTKHVLQTAFAGVGQGVP
jgi:tetratricopeptide (TPR) repeat protein